MSMMGVRAKPIIDTTFSCQLVSGSNVAIGRYMFVFLLWSFVAFVSLIPAILETIA